MLLIAFLILPASVAFSAGEGSVQTVFTAGQAVAGTASTVVSSAIPVSSMKDGAVWFQLTKGASVGSTIAVDMVMQASYTDTSSTFATAQTLKVSYSAATPCLVSVTNPNMKFVRFFVQGAVGNATDTTIEMRFFRRE